MKKFFDGGEYFVLTSYRIKTVPIAEDNEVGLTLAKTICEDACYLSSAGNGQTAIEILRIAGRKAGSRIHHLLTLRTHDSSEHDCVVRQEALEKGILSLLHQSGFTAEEVSFEKYRKHISEMDTDSVWALMKQDIQEYGVQETYKSPSVVESVDWKRIYSVLDGSGCGLCRNAFSLMPEVDLLPDQLTNDDREGLYLGRSVYSSKRLFVPLEQLLLHTAVMGKSGVGKTTLLKKLITQFQSRGIPVLILEPVKREYRDLVAGMKDSRVFTVERPVVPLLINPFYVPNDVPLGEYRSSLLSAFKAAFSLPDPLPALFEKAISEAYTLNGWTDISTSEDGNVSIFDMADFVRVFKRVISRSSYSNEVKGNMMSGGAFRLQSLIERCPRTFDTIHSTSVEDLLNGCAVLEMGSLEPEQKSLVSALTLISILAYLKSTRQSDHRLRNIVLIDEAHALLDQGEGATQEEKALNSTMTQLIINVITEIRAYGVGVIFSDQSPSRVGGLMLDNVDNIISFRLSGEEAEMLREHIGADNNLSDVLPLMSAGEFVLKNRFLRSALPARMDYSPDKEHLKHVSDEQIVKTHTKYLTAHGKDYCPFAFCEKAGCNHCSVAVREEANMFAEQIFAERQLKLSTPEEVAAHIIRIPSVLSFRINTENAAMFRKKCSCIAVHLLRKCSVENGISFGEQTVKKLLTDMNNHGKEGNGNE